MKYYYSYLKQERLYYPLVYHYSNIREDEGRITDHRDHTGCETSSEAYDKAKEWAETQLDGGELEIGN